MDRISFDNGCFLDYRKGSGNTWEVYDIHVPSEHRRMNYGRRLMEALFAKLGSGKRVWAITRADNNIGQQFYEKLQFFDVQPLRRFYGDSHGVDAIMYSRWTGGPV